MEPIRWWIEAFELQFIAKNVQLHEMCNGYELSAHSVDIYTRRIIARNAVQTL